MRDSERFKIIGNGVIALIEHTKVSSLLNTHTSEPAMVKYNSNLKIAQYAPAFSHLPRAGVTVNKYQINA